MDDPLFYAIIIGESQPTDSCYLNTEVVSKEKNSINNFQN